MVIVTKTLLGTRVDVSEMQRALVLRNGIFDRILGAGRHKLMGFDDKFTVQSFILNAESIAAESIQNLMRSRPELAGEHLTVFDVEADTLGLVSLEGKLHSVMRPETRRIFWTDAGEWALEKVNLSEGLTVPEDLSRRLLSISTETVKRFKVETGQVGLLHVDGAFVKSLEPGAHAFWSHGSVVTVKLIDTRDHALDVVGQEVLTKDRVSIRVNLSATYRVVDPVKAMSEVKDFADSLYRALGHAFRKSLASKTLDEILAQKGRVDDEAAKDVRDIMSQAGVIVSAITLKDIILPGDMRDILNTVVTAEKEAEANVIRRREETAATRALLNTAKVMADNPAMLRLKELEALETIADKVGTLTVHSGTEGLLNDIVSLKSSVKKTRKAS